MRRRMTRLAIRAMGIAMLLLLAGGCANNSAWQTISPGSAPCDDTLDCSGRYYRQYPNYDLAFAEFTERGHAFDTGKVNDVLQRIQHQAERDDGVITIVFIHGWLNNADETNHNLKQFREVLDAVAGYSAERFNRNRRVVGLYVGWRGKSMTLPVLKYLSFWNRKSVAQNLGSGAITQLLLKLDAIHRIGEDRTATKQNVMVTVGHSFGGAILLTAIKDVLVDRLIDPVANAGRVSEIDGIGDELFLLNPAIEASKALSIVDTAVEREYSPVQRPLLTIISSDADSATHKAFPAGQAFGTIAWWNQVDIYRDWYRHRDLDIPIPMREENLDVITVGNFAPFLTHRLRMAEDVASLPEQCSRFKVIRCDSNPAVCRARGWSKTARHKSIMPIPQGYPLRFIKTDRAVIAGHSDIFATNVRRLVSRLITDQLEGQTWDGGEESGVITACG